jgi:pimeloyl-ACP methyl ester carboxylesterase
MNLKLMPGAALSILLQACSATQTASAPPPGATASAPQSTVQVSSDVRLPTPTGALQVGFASWNWVDTGRADPAMTSGFREIVVSAWYPAQHSVGGAVSYPSGDDGGRVISHAREGAPWAVGARRAPVILLCPGRGLRALWNSALAEELASHGYAVFGIDSPGIGRAVFSDGRNIPPSPEYRASPELMRGPYENVDRFFEPVTALGAADISFAFERIRELDQDDPQRRFTNRLDFERVGLFGHSLGARICGAAAAALPGVRAYASMEGVPPRDVRRNGAIPGAALMMYSSEFPEAVALPNVEEIIPNRANDVFLARFQGLGHNSTTDLPLVDGASYAASPIEGSRLTRMTILDFFDAYLGDDTFPSARVRVESAITVREHRR